MTQNDAPISTDQTTAAGQTAGLWKALSATLFVVNVLTLGALVAVARQENRVVLTTDLTYEEVDVPAGDPCVEEMRDVVVAIEAWYAVYGTDSSPTESQLVEARLLDAPSDNFEIQPPDVVVADVDGECVGTVSPY